MNHSHDHHDHAGHSHGLTASQEVQHISDSKLLWTVALNHLLTIGQTIAGVLSGSMALLSDAAHNFNDANALLIAYIARRISRKSANEKYTFGYRRAEMIGALINLTLLAVVGLYLVYEATMRLIEPQPVIGWIMAWAAGLALVIDVATAALLWSMSRGSLNVRAAFVHNIVDALGSLAVLIGAAAIMWFDWTWIDPLITYLIAGYVLWHVVQLFPQACRVLMEGTPPELELSKMIESLKQVDRVHGIHHVHVWQLDEQHCAMEAHVVVDPVDVSHMESIKAQLKERLKSEFEIGHCTLEFEFAIDGGGCSDSSSGCDHGTIDCH